MADMSGDWGIAGYQHLMGIPINPHDHPADNINHPSGNNNTGGMDILGLFGPKHGSLNDQADQKGRDSLKKDLTK